MRRRQCRIGLVVLALLAFAPLGWAQQSVPLTIRNVTSEVLPTGEVVLVITGVGFGVNPGVHVDGQPVEVLPDFSDTRITVLAPPTVLSTPGTYRLTVANPAKKQLDEFVVMSPPATAAVAGAPLAVAGAGTGSTAAGRPSGDGTDASRVGRWPMSPGGGGDGAPRRLLRPDRRQATMTRAFGYQWFFHNSSATRPASGAPRAATTPRVGFRATAEQHGSDNTFFGPNALYSNTEGGDNTVIGRGAV